MAATYGSPVSVSTCNSWVSKNGLTHTVLRDVGGPSSVANALGLQVKDMAVLDRYLTIKYKGTVTGPFEQNQVLSVLNSLK